MTQHLNLQIMISVACRMHNNKSILSNKAVTKIKFQSWNIGKSDPNDLDETHAWIQIIYYGASTQISLNCYTHVSIKLK